MLHCWYGSQSKARPKFQEICGPPKSLKILIFDGAIFIVQEIPINLYRLVWLIWKTKNRWFLEASRLATFNIRDAKTSDSSSDWRNHPRQILALRSAVAEEAWNCSHCPHHPHCFFDLYDLYAWTSSKFHDSACQRHACLKIVWPLLFTFHFPWIESKSLISRPRCIGDSEVAWLYRLMVPLEQENEILQVQRSRCPMGRVCQTYPGIKQVGLGLVEWANWICFTEFCGLYRL